MIFIYYINHELMKYYFEKINNQFLARKIDFIIIKIIYYKMIELIVDRSIQLIKNAKNGNGKKFNE